MMSGHVVYDTVHCSSAFPAPSLTYVTVTNACRTHTKEKPFVCRGFSACQAAFSTLYRLTAHRCLAQAGGVEA